jgi:hypothetical protein
MEEEVVSFTRAVKAVAVPTLLNTAKNDNLSVALKVLAGIGSWSN